MAVARFVNSMVSGGPVGKIAETLVAIAAAEGELMLAPDLVKFSSMW